MGLIPIVRHHYMHVLLRSCLKTNPPKSLNKSRLGRFNTRMLHKKKCFLVIKRNEDDIENHLEKQLN